MFAPSRRRIPSSTTAAPTREGYQEWDSDDNTLNIGDGAATQRLWPTAGWNGAWTPTFGGVTLGTGAVIVGDYIQFGSGVDALVYFYAGFTLGTGGSLTANLSLTPPVGTMAGLPTWPVFILDSGTRRYLGVTDAVSASVIGFYHSEAGNAGQINGSNPMTWAVNDILRVAGWYRRAS